METEEHGVEVLDHDVGTDVVELDELVELEDLHEYLVSVVGGLWTVVQEHGLDDECVEVSLSVDEGWEVAEHLVPIVLLFHGTVEGQSEWDLEKGEVEPEWVWGEVAEDSTVPFVGQFEDREEAVWDALHQTDGLWQGTVLVLRVIQFQLWDHLRHDQLRLRAEFHQNKGVLALGDIGTMDFWDCWFDES